jgi:hypothetical protein
MDARPVGLDLTPVTALGTSVGQQPGLERGIGHLLGQRPVQHGSLQAPDRRPYRRCGQLQSDGRSHGSVRHQRTSTEELRALGGYEGFYTHYYLAPKVENSFLKYLKHKGYAIKAFYRVEGAFYNVGKAFKAYGFDEFIGGKELMAASNWGLHFDRDIVDAAVKHPSFSDKGFF